MKRTLKSIGPLQLGKIFAALYGLLSLIFIPFFLLFAALAAFIPTQPGSPSSGAIGIGFALVTCIVMPVVYAVLGFIIGVVGAWVYNMIAKWLGGIQFDVE